MIATELEVSTVEVILEAFELTFVTVLELASDFFNTIFYWLFGDFIWYTPVTLASQSSQVLFLSLVTIPKKQRDEGKKQNKPKKHKEVQFLLPI